MMLPRPQTPPVCAACWWALGFVLAGCWAEPPAGSMVRANGDSFRNIVIDSRRLVLVEFGLDSCKACKYRDALTKKHDEQLVVKVNADENEPRVKVQGVQLWPTLVVYHGGERNRRRAGAPKPENLAEIVSTFVTAK